jgi:anti-anti-sigma factor
LIGGLDIIPGRQAGSVIIGPDGSPWRSRRETADARTNSRFRGDILARTREAMEQLGEGLTNVVLDFGGVGFINSSGLAACIELRNGAAEKGARTILYQPTHDVLQVFTMVKVDRLFTTVHTAEELTGLVT